MRAGAVALLLWALAAAALAAPAGWQWEAGAGAEHASGGGEDRTQVDFALRRHLGERTLVEGNARATRRGDVSDQELGAGFAIPIDADWGAAGALTLSPSHHALARYGARGEVTRRLGAGFVASLGASRRLYDGGGNSSVVLGVERYAEAWRVAAAVSRVRLDGGATQGGARLQLDRYFADERGRVGVIAARGRELEGLPASAGGAADVLDQRVTALALVLAWPLADGWALTADASRVRHDDLRRASGVPAPAPYVRSGLHVGVRRDF